MGKKKHGCCCCERQKAKDDAKYWYQDRVMNRAIRSHDSMMKALPYIIAGCLLFAGIIFIITPN